MIETSNRTSLLSAAALLTALVAAPAFGAPIGIVNGDFETGSDNDAPPTGWTDLSVADDGGAPPAFWLGVPDEPGNMSAADAAAAPAPGVGDLFLTTARLSADEDDQPTDGTLAQTVDLSAFGAEIDAGDRILNVDFLYASGDERDSGAASLHFFSTTDGTGAELGGGHSVVLGPSGGFFFSGWEEVTLGGPIPVSARSVTLQINSTRTGGSETNVYFDSFVGRIVPEPTTVALLSLGALPLTCARRRT